MSQCSPHGKTNSTLDAVRVIRPVDRAILSRATTRCAPLDGLTCTARWRPARPSVTSVQAPVAMTVTRARATNSEPVSSSRKHRPDYALPLAHD